MSATNAPFGLRPAFHPSGLDRAQALANGIQAVSTSGNVSAGYATTILKGQPVKMNTAGYIEVVSGGGAFLGAFAGVEWTDSTGRRRVSNYWPANESFEVGSVVAYFIAILKSCTKFKPLEVLLKPPLATSLISQTSPLVLRPPVFRRRH
jgi:hypothetical protein